MKEKNKTIPFPKSMLYSSELKPAELLIYVYLIKVLFLETVSRNHFKINISQLAKKLNISRPTVISSINHLEELELLQLSENKLYYFDKYGNLESFQDFTIQGFQDGDLVSLNFGGYVEAPKSIIYNQELSASEKIAWLKIKSVKLNKVHLSGIATTTNININTFTKQIKSLKEKGFISYSVISTGSKVNNSEITNLKLNEEPVLKQDEAEIKEETQSAPSKPEVKENIFVGLSAGEKVKLAIKKAEPVEGSVEWLTSHPEEMEYILSCI